MRGVLCAACVVLASGCLFCDSAVWLSQHTTITFKHVTDCNGRQCSLHFGDTTNEYGNGRPNADRGPPKIVFMARSTCPIIQ